MDEKKHWCPKPGCKQYIDARNFQGNKGACSECGFELCLRCGAKYHGDKNCLYVIDDGFKDWVNSKDVNPCPKCKVPVEKDEGCQHMTCAMCRYQWCWICGGEYSDAHYQKGNFTGCPGMQFASNSLGILFFHILFIWVVSY